MIKVEVCAESVTSALTAQQCGACRVELCGNMAEGGTTPSFGQIAEVRKRLDIKLYPIIRPRGGDFLYSAAEFEVMKRDVEMCGRTGCDGIVVGMLRSDGSVDMERCRELAGIAHDCGMGVTFHRAFDVAADHRQALEDIIALGCERILTSGGAATAEEGIAELRALVEAAGERIIVMAGAGITPGNVERIAEQTGCREIHGTFRSRYESMMEFTAPAWADCGIWHADPEKVKAVVEIAKKFR